MWRGIMKTRMLLAFLPVAIVLHAAPLQARTLAAENTAPFHWSCARSGPPSVAEIRDHFGIANAGQAYQWHRASLPATRVPACGTSGG